MVPTIDMTPGIVAKQLGDTTAAEEALARAHEFLAETLRAKAELMTQMGHEIRTPLNGIVGMTELLLGTGLSDEQREYAAATMTSASTLMVVINDVLDFSMLEAGTLELDVGTFEVRHLVESIASGAQARAGKEALAISMHFTDDVPEAVSGDGHRVRHVLTKLVDTATANAAGAGLEIGVAAGSFGSKRVLLRFEVVAQGVLEEDPDSLFEVTSYASGAMQADRPTTIGLAVSKQLVELMGGEIGVHGAPGEPTTFWFTTPVGIDGARPYPEERIRFMPEPGKATAPGRSPTNLSAKVAGPGGARLLIADDDPVSQLVLTRQLEARGFSVDVASNGREVLDLHAKDSYGAIFMDCQMPELNGYEATTAIREREGASAHTPIIAMTASARDADREQCATSGMDDYLAKPLDQVTLDAALARRILTYDPSATQASTSGGKNGGRKGARSAAQTPAVPLLENSVLTDVFRHDSESRGYLIGVFIDESRTRIAQLAAAETAGDEAVMQRLSHALKGSAAAVGARQLEQVCRTIHEAVIAGHVEVASKLQGTLKQSFDLTCDLLRKGCPETHSPLDPAR
jgi:CheY-like chemotaxis protein/HPt (histidine-containing phosphotransfer) domain-containing protein/nitrogen-specific signal transduction histidine kinase